MIIAAHDDIAFAGPVTSGGMLTLTSSDAGIRVGSTLSAGGALSISAQSSISFKSSVTARNMVSIISQNGDVAAPVAINAQSGSTLTELTLSAGGSLILAGGTLPVVTTRMTLSAGQELETGVGEPSWVVSGVNGELSVTAGGDVLFLLNTVMQADKRVTIRSTGYVDDQGNAVGGNGIS